MASSGSVTLILFVIFLSDTLYLTSFNWSELQSQYSIIVSISTSLLRFKPRYLRWSPIWAFELEACVALQQLSLIRQFVFICNCPRVCGYRQKWIEYFCLILEIWLSGHCRLQSYQGTAAKHLTVSAQFESSTKSLEKKTQYSLPPLSRPLSLSLSLSLCLSLSLSLNDQWCITRPKIGEKLRL